MPWPTASRRNSASFFAGGIQRGRPLVIFRRYIGQESDADRQEIIHHPPDIFLTNYVMLDLILTRTLETNLLKAAQGLQFLVFDKLHTYRGRQGVDVALLIRRVRKRLDSQKLLCIGTSATIAGSGSYSDQ